VSDNDLTLSIPPESEENGDNTMGYMMILGFGLLTTISSLEESNVNAPQPVQQNWFMTSTARVRVFGSFFLKKIVFPLVFISSVTTSTSGASQDLPAKPDNAIQ
jgi:hypothetical protein